MRVAAACLALALVAGTRVVAHDLARSESRIDVDGSTLRCTLVVDLLEIGGVDVDGNGAISYAELDRAIADVFAGLKQHLRIRADGEADRIVLTRHELIDEHTARLLVTYSFPGRVSRVEVTSTIDRLARRSDHQHLVTVIQGGRETRAVLDAGRPTAVFEQQWWTTTSLWLTLAALAIVGGRVAWFVRARRRAPRCASSATS